MVEIKERTYYTSAKHAFICYKHIIISHPNKNYTSQEIIQGWFDDIAITFVLYMCMYEDK